jgi:hypothetical protein
LIKGVGAAVKYGGGNFRPADERLLDSGIGWFVQARGALRKDLAARFGDTDRMLELGR